MNRTAFLAEVRRLAAELGSQLYDLVAGEAERVRATALETATTKLRAAVGEADPAAVESIASVPSRRRSPPRCKHCGELGHNARRHGGKARASETEAAAAPALAPSELETAAVPELVDPPDTDEDRNDEDEDDGEGDRTFSSPPRTRSDRFARIEASARARRAHGA